MKRANPVLYLVVLITCFFFSMYQQGYALNFPDTLHLNQQGELPILNYLYWMETDAEVSPEEAVIAFNAGKGKILYPEENLHSTALKNTYWLSFTLDNNGPTTKKFYYQFNYPLVKNVQFYRYSDAVIQKLAHTGTSLPFSSRAYPYHDFVFPLEVQSGEVLSYLFQIDPAGERFSTNPKLYSASQFNTNEQRVYATIGAMAGIILFNMIVNLFLGISLGDKIHFLYAAYVLAALSWILASGGFISVIFPVLATKINIIHLFTAGFTMLLMTELTLFFHGLSVHSRILHYLLRTCQGLIILVLSIRLCVDVFSIEYTALFNLTSTLIILSSAGIAVGSMVATVLRILQGYRPAWFYFCALCFLVLFICKTCYNILVNNDLSVLSSPPTAIQIGLIIETVVVFMGIIYRYSFSRREKNRLVTQLERQKQIMTRNVIIAQEEERERLAKDLHDDLGATLSTLLLQMTNQPNALDKKQHDFSIEITKKAISDLRHISHDLLPQDFAKVGLFQSLQDTVDRLNAYTKTRFVLIAEGEEYALNNMQKITIFRIINELVSNTVKHAHAAQANIDVHLTANQLILIYEDDGIGFDLDQDKGGIGLKNIRSRIAYLNAHMNIDNNKKGTTVIIEVPLNEKE